MIPKNLEDLLYEIIDIDLLNSDKIENYPNIDSQSYAFGNINGVIDISSGSFSTAHSFEEDEIGSQLKELLEDIFLRIIQYLLLFPAPIRDIIKNQRSAFRTSALLNMSRNPIVSNY